VDKIISWAVPNLIRLKALTTSHGEVAGDEDRLLSFDVPGAILRVLYVRKPCLLELW